MNDLAGAPTTNTTGNVIAGQAAGATQGTHESTFRNPSAVYNANVGQDMGGLETGVNKNIAQTQESLNKSSADYQSQLQGIDSGYKYGGRQDLENIGDTATFSRLSSLVNPAGEQSQLAGVKSNSANYRPDTSGLAQSSTMGGLSSQLQNQYGTSAGGSRLDALLYRGGGNAGKAINEGLGQVNQFNQGQQQQLGQESNLLSQLQKGAVDKSNQLKSEGAAYKGQLKAGAATQAQQAQATYDAARATGLGQLQQTVDNTNYKTQLENILNSVFGTPSNPTRRLDRNFIGIQYQMEGQMPKMIEAAKAALTAQLKSEGVSEDLIPQILASATRGGFGASLGGTTLDMSPYAKQQIMNQFLGQIDMKSVDPTKFQGEARTFNQDSYLDPRFNQLGQLLGTEQIAGTTAPSGQYNQDQQGLQKAISDYLNPQFANARSAASALFNPTYQQGSNENNPYLTSIQNLLKSPAFNSVVSGGGVAALAPNIQKWVPGVVDTLTDPLNNPQQLIQDLWG